MLMQKRSIHAVRPHVTNQAGLFTSLVVWGMCSGIRAKIFWLVLCTWAQLGWSIKLHHISGTLPNGFAWYWLGVLIALTGILVKVLFLHRDAKHRSVALFRSGIDLGPA